MAQSRFRGFVTTVLLGAVSFCVVFGLVIHHFGSITAARAFLRGDVVSIDSHIDLGTLMASQRTTHSVPIRNLTGHEVRLIGSKGTCGCVSAPTMPLTIPPGESLDLVFKIKPEDAGIINGLHETVELFLDVSDPITLSFEASVR